MSKLNKKSKSELANHLTRKNDCVFVVADIGKNFIQTAQERPRSEYLRNAKELIRSAKEAGVDAVKFQTHEVKDEQFPIRVVSPHFRDVDRHSWIKRVGRITTLGFWRELKNYCDNLEIDFFSTPMSRLAAEKLEKVGVSVWKIGSGDTDDFVMLDYIVETGKPIIISTGMVSFSELEKTVKFISEKNLPLAILYCISEYPCPPHKFNLSTIKRLKDLYPQAVIGFSDHSLGYEAALAAVKTGARIIEKHFSTSRDLWGPDHKVSMIPGEMGKMILALREGEHEKTDIKPYYGNIDLELDGASNKFRPIFKKSIMAGRNIKAGEKIKEGMVYAMRSNPQTSLIPAGRYHEIIGRRIKFPVKRFEAIRDKNLV